MEQKELKNQQRLCYKFEIANGMTKLPFKEYIKTKWANQIFIVDDYDKTVLIIPKK